MSDYVGPFTVTQIKPNAACMGSEPSLDRARAYVRELQELGLCEEWSIGTYRDKCFVQVERSEKINE